MNYELKNCFTLVGNISSINEIKEQSNGTKYRYFGLAQNNKYKSKNGEDVQETSFFSLKIYEKDFNKYEKLLKVGNFVYVQGYLKTYKDKDNKTQEVKIVKNMRDLSKVNNISKEVEETMNDLGDYDWLEDDCLEENISI